jgi:hypothetical protein
MIQARFISMLVLAAGVLGTGCAVSSDPDDLPAARFERIDEVQGTYGGVGIGDSEEDVWAVFGRKDSVGHEESFQPTGAGDEFFGPTHIPAKRATRMRTCSSGSPSEMRISGAEARCVGGRRRLRAFR